LGISGRVLNFCSLVIVDGFQIGIRNRLDFRREIPSCAKTELRMGGWADSNPYLFSISGTFDQEGITGIVVLALIERAQQPDARLNCNDEAFYACLQHAVFLSEAMIAASGFRLPFSHEKRP
jgi:hypothetical protein